MSMAAITPRRRMVLALVCSLAMISACRPSVSIGPGATAISTKEASVERTATATPVKTKVPTPTKAAPTKAPPTPAPTQPPATTIQCTIKTRGLNIRGGPGTNFPVVTAVRNGATLAASGKNDKGDWLAVKAANGKEGWAATKYLNCNPAPDSLPVKPGP